MKNAVFLVKLTPQSTHFWGFLPHKFEVFDTSLFRPKKAQVIPVGHLKFYTD